MRQLTRSTIVEIAHENPDRIVRELSHIASPSESIVVPMEPELFSDIAESADKDAASVRLSLSPRTVTMSAHHDVRAEDIDLKRLGAVLAVAYESPPKDFESLLLTPGLGPRTLQSLALVSEIVYGTPSRFTDPARFSFAHGGKDGHPFPVPCRIYDETIRVLGDGIEKSKLGDNDKTECLRRLYATQLQIERFCSPEADFDKAVAYEKAHSKSWDGKRV